MQFRIKQCREEAGLSQEALSERAGVSRTIISGLESGKISDHNRHIVENRKST